MLTTSYSTGLINCLIQPACFLRSSFNLVSHSARTTEPLLSTGAKEVSLLFYEVDYGIIAATTRDFVEAIDMLIECQNNDYEKYMDFVFELALDLSKSKLYPAEWTPIV